MADTASTTTPTQPDVDPRVERSRSVILAAALDLLSEAGYGGLTIEAVAARAGVGKSTIYRHWSGKLDLVEDAIRTLKAWAPPTTAGPVRDRVVELLQHVAARMADSMWSNCLPAIIDAAERDPEVCAIQRQLATERRQFLVRLVAEGVASGEFRADLNLELAAESLVGPIVLRRLLLHEPFDPQAVPVLVDQVLTPPGQAPTARRHSRR